MDMKESMEALEGMVVLGEFGGAVLADGKVNASDMPHLVSLSLKAPVLGEAYKDISKVKAELMDIDKEELVAFIAAFYEGVQRVEKAKADNK